MSDKEREDWLGICVEDDDQVWLISADGRVCEAVSPRPAGLFWRLVAAGFPLCRVNGPADPLMVDLSIKPSRLPLADVTAYSQGPQPREHPMGEAGAVVAEWLQESPGVLDDVLAYVPDADNA